MRVSLRHAEFDCPEATLCGWQDVKSQILTSWAPVNLTIVMISDGGHHSDGHHREEGSLQHGASQAHPQLQVQGEAGKEAGS